MIDSEHALVSRAQEGDRVAFEELVRRTSRLVYARLYLETGDAQHAEDLLQDTMLTAFRTISQLSQPDKFRSWLLRIAHNAAIDAVRHDTRKKRTPERDRLRLRQEALAPRPPDEQMEQEELRQKILAILRSLPEEYRLPMTLRYVVGADYETIQMQTGLTNGALRGLLHRGMQRLRDELKRALGESYPSEAVH